MTLEACGRASNFNTRDLRIGLANAFAHHETDLFHVRVRRRLAGGQPPAGEYGDAIGNLEQLFQVFGNQQDGNAIVA